MDDTPLQYDKWVEESLRGVVRRALVLAASRGLPDEHHFYITFRTRAEGVRLPAHLRAQHPNEMTIVLQNQFWDLEVEDEAFSVTLNFNRVSERLRVPIDAITTFADPGVNFGLQLGMTDDADADTASAQQPDAGDDAAPAGNGNDDGANDAAPSGEVIALDTFRRK
jgi:hypothetical protein